MLEKIPTTFIFLGGSHQKTIGSANPFGGLPWGHIASWISK